MVGDAVVEQDFLRRIGIKGSQYNKSQVAVLNCHSKVEFWGSRDLQVHYPLWVLGFMQERFQYKPA